MQRPRNRRARTLDGDIVRWSSPQRRVAPGQSVVFFDPTDRTCSAAASPANGSPLAEGSKHEAGPGRGDDERLHVQRCSPRCGLGRCQQRVAHRPQADLDGVPCGWPGEVGSLGACQCEIDACRARHADTINVSPSTTWSCTTTPAGTNTNQRRANAVKRGSSSTGRARRRPWRRRFRRSNVLSPAVVARRARRSPRPARRQRLAAGRRPEAEEEAMLVAVGRGLNAVLTEVGATNQEARDKRAHDTNTAPRIGVAPAIQLSAAAPQLNAADHPHDRESE